MKIQTARGTSLAVSVHLGTSLRYVDQAPKYPKVVHLGLDHVLCALMCCVRCCWLPFLQQGTYLGVCQQFCGKFLSTKRFKYDTVRTFIKPSARSTRPRVLLVVNECFMLP